jgi:[ribosomal protein S18]-alanine N-acetyltransferase
MPHFQTNTDAPGPQSDAASTLHGGATFRDFVPGDFARLCELDQLCFPEEIAYTPDEITAGLMQAHTSCIVAEADGRVAGFILLHYRRAVGHVITIDLEPAIRRRGVGTRLMELGEQQFRERGIRRMVLEVAVDNDAAIAFYEGRGYLRQRVLRRYYRDGTDAYLMEKPLTARPR